MSGLYLRCLICIGVLIGALPSHAIASGAGSDRESIGPIVSILESESRTKEKEARLVDAFGRLNRQGALTLTYYRRLAAHPSAAAFFSGLNRALGRTDPVLAVRILSRMLTRPGAFPFDAERDMRQSAAFALSRLTDSNTDTGLFAALLRERDPDIRILVARSYVDSRRVEVRGLAISWSRALDRDHIDSAPGASADPGSSQRQLGHRRGLNRLLARVGANAELLRSLKRYADSSPTWLVKDGIELLGKARFRPAFALFRRVALDRNKELVTRTAALGALARVYTPDQKNDVATVARRLLADAKGEIEFPKVRAIVDRLDGR